MLVTPQFEGNMERKPLSPGKHIVKIIGCEHKVSKAGNPYLNWKFETKEGRQWVYMPTMLSGRGAKQLKELINATADPAYVAGPIETDMLVDCELAIMLEQKPDSQYMEVVGVAKADESLTF